MFDLPAWRHTKVCLQKLSSKNFVEDDETIFTKNIKNKLLVIRNFLLHLLHLNWNIWEKIPESREDKTFLLYNSCFLFAPLDIWMKIKWKTTRSDDPVCTCSAHDLTQEPSWHKSINPRQSFLFQNSWKIGIFAAICCTITPRKVIFSTLYTHSKFQMRPFTEMKNLLAKRSLAGETCYRKFFFLMFP